MSDEANPNTTPIVIQTNYEAEKLDLGNNRFSQASETGYELLNKLAFPASWPEILLQANRYLFSGLLWGTFALVMVPAYPVLAVPFAVVSVAAAFVGHWMSQRYSSARLFLRYRFILFFLGGLVLAPLPWWVQLLAEVLR